MLGARFGSKVRRTTRTPIRYRGAEQGGHVGNATQFPRLAMQIIEKQAALGDAVLAGLAYGLSSWKGTL
jgi:hypothetical protein